LCNGCSDIPPFLNVFSYTHAFAMNMYHCNLQAINQSKKNFALLKVGEAGKANKNKIMHGSMLGTDF